MFQRQSRLENLCKRKKVNLLSAVTILIAIGAINADLFPKIMQELVDQPIRIVLTLALIVVLVFSVSLRGYCHFFASNSLVILHESRFSILKEEIETTLDNLGKFSVEKMDLTPFVTNNQDFDWLAIQKYHKEEFKTLQKAIPKYSKLVYAGLAEIPSIIHLGHLFSARYSFSFFHRHRNPVSPETPWKWPLKKIPKNWEIKVLGSEHLDKNIPNIALLIEQSATITEEDLAGLGLPTNTIRISIPNPDLNDLRSEKQIYKFQKKLRKILKELSWVNSIHILAAIPPPTAFVIGQEISDTMHPKVYLYHYNRSESPRYIQSIVLNEKQ